MKAQELAQLLNGRECGNEITKTEEAQAKAYGMVVVFGYSSDNVELRGVISDELGAPRIIYIDEEGVLPPHDDGDCECPYCGYEKRRNAAESIECVWHDVGEYSWTYKPEIPPYPFDIMEDGTKFCQGIVFNIADMRWRSGS